MNFTSLEVAIFFFAVAGLAAGISISFLIPRKKAESIVNAGKQGEVNPTSHNHSLLSVESLDELQDQNMILTPESIIQGSREQIESMPSITKAVDSISAFQAQEIEAPSVPAFSSEVATIAEAAQENNPRPISRFSNGKAIKIEKQMENTGDKQDASPSVAEAVSTSQFVKHDDLPTTPDCASFAFPTDSIALQNVSAAPFPIRAEPIRPERLNFVSGVSPSFAKAPAAYCVKCKSKKEMRDPQAVTMKNGKPAISGFCRDCGTRVFRIGKFPSA